MSIWFEGTSEIDCSILQVNHALENLGEHYVVFDNQKRRQKIIKNSVTPINTKKDDRQKRRHLCIKNI